MPLNKEELKVKLLRAYAAQLDEQFVGLDEELSLTEIEEVALAFPDGEADRLDGLTVQYPDWWFNLRPSNTEPLLRLNAEANNQQLLNEKTEKLLKIIRS